MNIRRSLGNAVGLLMIVVVSVGGPTAAAIAPEAGGLPGVKTSSTSTDAAGLPGAKARVVTSAPVTGQRVGASRTAGLPG